MPFLNLASHIGGLDFYQVWITSTYFSSSNFIFIFIIFFYPPIVREEMYRIIPSPEKVPSCPLLVNCQKKKKMYIEFLCLWVCSYGPFLDISFC